MKLHWLKCNWTKWTEPIRQGMKLYPSESAWNNNPDKADYFRWVQERNCITCNKIQRRKIVVEE
jgi:hypothetical protein